MTTINTSSLGMYSSGFTAAIKTSTDSKASDTKSGEVTSVDVNLRGNVYQTGDDAKAGAAAPSSPAEEQIERIQKQIKDVQKQLLRQQQQLSAAQNSKGSEEEKAQQVMSIQQQISATQAQLATLQAALLTVMKGNVNTTA
ncbi:hypothetical protein AUC61_11210 [Pseudomonas sp. S25]|uniref:FlxA-like protein n=1 Tax=Pseudomonas maioricensis TaxID=1766623 RepID=A0ABS9ZHM4_9PSED|nr:FlxA-like family protein [Pseudomonas sp. S25]MCI8210105.1 hypothetical protein [Pseudomonas sp. S25]